MPNTLTYPFDTTGLAVSNLISSEQHAVTEVNFRDFYFIVPNFAPFFMDRLVVRHQDSSGISVLNEGLDYYPALPYIGATRSIGKPVYGAIALNSRITTGIIEVTYQTLGGDWVANRLYVLERLAEKVYNPRLTVWDNVTDKATEFPPINHSLDIDQVYGQQDLINAITSIANNLLATRDPLGIVQHFTKYDNPHRVTKEQLGLSNIGNWPMGTTADIAEGEKTDVIVNPGILKPILDGITDLISSSNTDVTELLRLLNNHKDNTTNPHNVTKDQLGLGKVGNWGMSTEAEAVAGVASNVIINPVVLKVITDALSNAITDHLNDTANPHSVNKSDVGLSFIENLPMATMAEVMNKESVDKYITLKQLSALLATFTVTPPPPTTPTYAIVAASTSVNEGSDTVCNVTTTNVANGTVLYWTVGHITTGSADFVATQGTVTINSNVGTFTVTAATDALIEVNETFNVQLRDVSYTGAIVATTANVTVVNTTAAPTYAVTAISSSVNEGTSLACTINTTGLVNGTILYWTLNHISTADADFTTSLGTVTINSNTGTFNIPIATDLLVEAVETFNIQVRTVSYTGTVVASSVAVSVVSTTVAQTYAIAPSTTTINEAESVTLTVSTTGIADGTLLYWTINHTSTNSSDFTGDNGTVTINANTASFVISSKRDLVNELSELFKVQLRAVSVSGTILAETNVITLLESIKTIDLYETYCIFDPYIARTARALFIVGNR